MTFSNKWQHDYHLKYSLRTSRATVIGCNDTLIVEFIICSLRKCFKVFPSPAVLLFLSRLCKKTFLVSRFRFCQQIPSADFCSQQILFLSADSISKFLSSADLFFVSKCLCRRHGNDAHAGIFSFAPARFLPEKFLPSAGAHFASCTIPFVLPDLPAQTLTMSLCGVFKTVWVRSELKNTSSTRLRFINS